MSSDDTPTDDSGFNLHLVIRATFDDQDNGDMTVIDFPVDLPLTTDKGEVRLETQTDVLPDAIEPLPPCTELELLRLTVTDPDGSPFAVLGSGTRPKL